MPDDDLKKLLMEHVARLNIAHRNAGESIVLVTMKILQDRNFLQAKNRVTELERKIVDLTSRLERIHNISDPG